MGMKELESNFREDYSELEKEGYAKWQNSNGQRYLEVYAPDQYTLGFLQGKSLSKHIYQLKKIIEVLSLRFFQKKNSYNRFKTEASNYEEYIPKKYKLEMQGMADAIKNINYEDILIQNCFFDYYYGFLLPKDPQNRSHSQINLGCTSFGVINKEGPITAQNFDYPAFFKSVLSFVHIKTPDLKELFSLRLGSQLSTPSGANNFGLHVRINSIKSNAQGFFTTPTSIRSRLALEECRNAEQAFKFQTKLKESPASCNLIVSDNSKIIAMEIIPEDYTKKEVDKLIVKSNTFITDSFQKFLIKLDYSKKRQEYAERRLRTKFEVNDNFLSDENLLTILADDPIICRRKSLKIKTLAFITNKYFGLGNAKQNKPGLIPLNL